MLCPTTQAELAAQKGIREIQFNQIGAGSFAVQTGFLGMAVQYGDKSEVIDFIEDASGLEYQLSRLILKLTRDQQPKVGLISQAGDGSFSGLQEYLQKQYDVVMLSESAQATDFADLTSVIVLDDGSDKTATTSSLVQQYLANGGNGVLFVNGVTINRQSLTGTKSTSDYLNLVAPWGVTVNPDLVYDLQMNEAISLGNGNSRYVMPYPYWVKALLNPTATPWQSGTNNAVLGWPSSLSMTAKEGINQTALLSTSKAAGVMTENFAIAPAQINTLPKTANNQYSLSALIEKGKQRIGVVGNTTVASDDFLSNSQENVVFVVNLIDWATADPMLLSIPQKGGGRTVFTFTNPRQVQVVQYASIFAPPLIVAGFGFWWLSRRKRKTLRVYEK